MCKHGRNMPKISLMNYKLGLNAASKCNRVMEFSACPPSPACSVVEPQWNVSRSGLNQESTAEGGFRQQLSS